MMFCFIVRYFYVNVLDCFELHLLLRVISPSIFKNWLNINYAHKCLFRVYTRSNALGVRPGQIWQQGYHNNACHVAFSFSLTWGRSLYYFLVLLLLTLNILCLLWMSLNATLNVYLWGIPSRRYIYGSGSKTLVSNCANYYYSRITNSQADLCLYESLLLIKLYWQIFPRFIQFVF